MTKKKKKRSKSTGKQSPVNSPPIHGSKGDVQGIDNLPGELLDPTEEMQQEVEVLKAIYGDDFQWKKGDFVSGGIAPFSIKVRSDIGGHQKNPAELTMVVVLGRCYPNIQVPTITLENSVGLSDDQIDELEDILSRRSEELLGQVMIHDLVVEAQEYLSNNVKEQTTFYEQMVNRQHEEEREKELEHQHFVDLEEKKALEEDRVLQEVIRSELVRKGEKVKEEYLKRRRNRASLGSFHDDNLSDNMEVNGLEVTKENQSSDNGSLHHSSESSSEFGDSDREFLSHSSRYYNDFKELGLLGRGGGGEVVKVKNRLDRQFYAVKKVKLDSDDPLMKRKILREVKTISRLQHRHIVRYYQAWIEGGDDGSSSEDVSETDVDEENWLDDDSDQDDDDSDQDDWFGTKASISRSHGSKQGLNNHLVKSRSYVFESEDEDVDEEWAALETAPGNTNENQWEWTVDAKFNDDKMESSNVSVERKNYECLFIQMEYCEGKNLREVIDTGELWKNPEKVWRLFRQIVEAIAYIHSQRVIHRDIKPPNIFLDSEGAVKLGDFGLATRPPRFDDQSDSSEEGNEEDDFDRSKLLSEKYLESFGESITAGVGTAFYRAPEQEREGQRYNQKADMFSLGILFFEMWSPPFTTLMERAESLTSLRLHNTLPPYFIERAPEKVQNIITWLCSPNPSFRPSPNELLSSNLLPPKMELEEKYLEEALQTLANPAGTCFSQLMQALFVQDPLDHVDYTYNVSLNSRRRLSFQDLNIKNLARNLLQTIFERHGAVAQSTPLLAPRPPKKHWGLSNGSCTLLDSSGVPVNLPYDLTEPLARYVARNGISQLKRFYFGRVFRNTPGGGHPREFYEASFDTIWDERTAAISMDLEVICVITEVMESLRNQLPQYYISISNYKVVKAIFDACDVGTPFRRVILRLLNECILGQIHSGNASKTTVIKPGKWKRISRALLEIPLKQSVVDLLQPFFFLPQDALAAVDAIEEALLQLDVSGVMLSKEESIQEVGLPSSSTKPTLTPITTTSILRTTSTECSTSPRMRLSKKGNHLRRSMKEALCGIASLRQLIHGMKEIKLTGPSCIIVNLGLFQRREHYSSGLVFQAALLPDLKGGGFNEVIAEGGRYDSLVARYRLPAARLQAPVITAVGVRFAMDKIVDCIHGQLDQSPPLVLVCSMHNTPSMALTKIKIARSLWKAGIKTCFLHPEHTILEDIEEYGALSGAQWLIVIQKHLLVDKASVKVRAVKNPTVPDQTVEISSLVEFCMEKIVGGGSSDPLNPELQSIVLPESKKSFDIRIVGSKYQQKDRQSKTKELQSIERKLMKWVDSLLLSRKEKPSDVISVDVPFLILRDFSTAYMKNGLSSMEAVYLEHAKHRKTLKQVADLIVEIQQSDFEGKREKYVILYSSSEDRYDLLSLLSLNAFSSSVKRLQKKTPATPTNSSK